MFRFVSALPESVWSGGSRANHSNNATWSRAASRRIASRLLIVLHLVITAWLASPAEADSTSLPMVVFSKSSNNNLFYAQWNGSAWTPAGGTSCGNVGANPYWVVLRNCPKRNEMACGSLDADYDVNVLFFNGTSWSGVTEVCDAAPQNNDRCFDLAYEQQTGDCLIVYSDNGEGNIGYRTYNGASLSAEVDLSVPPPSTVEYIALYPKPESDEIMMLVCCSDGGSRQLRAAVWNGSSFGNWSTLTGSLDTADEECFSFAYQSLSGAGLAVYSHTGSNQPRYRTWDGTNWSSESTMSTVGGVTRWVRLIPDPTSNRIMYAGQDASLDLNARTWNGSSWGSVLELETSMSHANIRQYDLAYEGQTSKCLVVFDHVDSDEPRYVTHNGSSWSGASEGPVIDHESKTIQLRSSGVNNDIFVGIRDGDGDLELMRWNGSTLTNRTTINGSVGGLYDSEPFMIATPTAPVLTPANIPYAHDFESSMGAEWSDGTRSYVSTYTNYAGRHHSKALKLALNTTPGETYTVMFDFYAIDSWDGSTSNNNSAPDYFNIRAGSTQIFSHTLTHEWPGTRAGSYPYSYDQIGNYGYNSWHKDAIYRKMQATFTATDTTTTLAFQGVLTDENNAGVGDESWGLDNIVVEVARFVDVSSATGFAVSTSTNFNNYGGGMSWGDFDNDGDLDCFISGNTAQLLKNNDAGASFTAVSLGDLRRQAAMVDIDNDGDLDVWVATTNDFNTERCMLNSGSASFSSGGNLGFSGPSNNENCAVADVNADGWPDIVMFSENGNWIGHHTGSTTPALTGTNASSYGLHTSGQYGNGDYASVGDVNQDGRLDFFYHYGGGRLFCSNGDGTYTYNNRNIVITTGESLKIGSAWGDYDNDGDLDLATARMSEACSGYLWRNNCFTPNGFTGNFTNVTSSAGLALNTVVDYGPDDKPGTRSVAWGDYDNDGDLDLFILGAKGAHYLYQNQGNGAFQRVAHGISTTGNFIDCCFVDYDNDGDLDLALTRENGTAMLFRNRTNNTNYLKVCLTGRGAGGTPKDAIGTRVELWNAAGTQLLARRDIGVARGYGGTEPIWAHFGGVNPSTEYQLKVYFATTTTVKTVRPGEATTTIGLRTIPQMISISEASPATIIKWKENVNKPSL